MPIDYSQPGYKEMFANYGLTAIEALSLEKTLLLLIAAIDNLGKGNHPKEVLHEYLKSNSKKTMGFLIGEVKKRMNLPPSLEANLKKVVTDRNHIIHHFFMDEYEIMILPNGPTILSNKLRPIRDFLATVHSEIDELVGLVIAELRKPINEISPIVRNMLKGSDF
jgi:hypothetical protein